MFGILKRAMETEQGWDIEALSTERDRNGYTRPKLFSAIALLNQSKKKIKMRLLYENL